MKLLVRPPQLLRALYKGSLWRMDKKEPTIYLTFDDGPIPELTEWVLDVLKEYQIKATFFCVGDNIVKNPSIFQRIKSEGHQVGNHTFNHMKGWEVKNAMYVENTERCQELTKTNLFRPPYGRIKKSQYKILAKNYKVVFWDVLSYDYDRLTSSKKCLDNSIKYTRNGSIIVFHDNIKAQKNLKFALPQYIEHFLKLNYKFATL
ncbi:MAG: polysaccharide deacetylase family protein [Bacteroidetes bacterium]|jgi:peptidoglycan/xylan/chitin deacetylase (PgdA/CDA1 family)|nr:polysaccharide deacetylase family protein [Bacteroidota bacterium]